MYMLTSILLLFFTSYLRKQNISSLWISLTCLFISLILGCEIVNLFFLEQYGKVIFLLYPLLGCFKAALGKDGQRFYLPAEYGFLVLITLTQNITLLSLLSFIYLTLCGGSFVSRIFTGLITLLGYCHEVSLISVDFQIISFNLFFVGCLLWLGFKKLDCIRRRTQLLGIIYLCHLGLRLSDFWEHSFIMGFLLLMIYAHWRSRQIITFATFTLIAYLTLVFKLNEVCLIYMALVILLYGQTSLLSPLLSRKLGAYAKEIKGVLLATTFYCVSYFLQTQVDLALSFFIVFLTLVAVTGIVKGAENNIADEDIILIVGNTFLVAGVII